MQFSKSKGIQRSTAALLVALTAGLVSQAASAVPQYLTFSGAVDSISDDAGIAASSGVGIGTAVSYTYMVDRDRAGQSGYRVVPDREYASSSVDSFYVDFVGGSLINSKGVHSNIEFNVGRDIDYTREEHQDYTYMIGDTRVNQTSVFSWSSDALSTIGSTWSGFEVAFNSAGLYSAVGSLLQLTGISSTNPVSVPEMDASSALIIFALLAAIIGIGIERRKPEFAAA